MRITLLNVFYKTYMFLSSYQISVTMLLRISLNMNKNALLYDWLLKIMHNHIMGDILSLILKLMCAQSITRHFLQHLHIPKSWPNLLSKMFSWTQVLTRLVENMKHKVNGSLLEDYGKFKRETLKNKIR